MIPKRYILLFLLGGWLATNSYGQAWELFPYQQKSYYLNKKTGNLVSSIIADSIFSSGQRIVYHFNRSSYPITCNANWINNVNAQTICPDSVLNYPDSVLIWQQNKYLILQLNSTKPDSSSLNGKIITRFLDITADITFGEPDSIRTYEVSNGMIKAQLKWSKHFGLTQYIDLNELNAAQQAFQVSTLIGLKSQTQQLGYQSPQPKDFFPYKPGDQLMRKYHRFDLNFPQNRITTYTLDSILSIKDTGSILSYQCKSVSLSFPGNQTSSGIVTIKLEHPLYFVPLSNWIWVDPHTRFLNKKQVYEINEEELEITGNDTVVIRSMYNNGFTIDSICNLSQISDLYEWTTIYTDGRYNYHGGYFIEFTDELIGYKHADGRTWGNIEFPAPTGMKEPEQALHLYPNPVKDKLILPETTTKYGYQIYVHTGQLVIEGNCDTGILNLSTLPQGIYLIYLTSDKGHASYRFIKE